MQKVYGPLKDQDRIFTNLYGRHDWKLQGALKRVSTGNDLALLYIWKHGIVYYQCVDAPIEYPDLDIKVKARNPYTIFTDKKRPHN